MIRLIIFDLDGTLLYTLDSITLSTNTVLQRHGLAPLSAQTVKCFIGDGVIDLLRRAFECCGSDETVYEKIVEEFRECFFEHCDYGVHPYDGTLELLEWLKQQNILFACK